MNTLNDTPKNLLGGLVAALAVLLAAPALADTSYSFPSVVDGPATVLGTAGERESVEANMPILVGDRLWVPYDSRLEVVLADRSLLRVDGDSEITFTSIAGSADIEDRVTVLEVRQGHLQLVVPEGALGDALPQLVTPDATIYVHDPGTYRVTVSDRGWTELVVRDGRAEIAGERNGSLVYPGESAVVEGGSRPHFEVRLADRPDDLERWGDYLTREAELAYAPHVDPALRYAAAPLSSNGVWVSIGSRWAWRPRVEVSWQPYGQGYWRPTPAGLTWVSYEPWGYVTHHYGLWDYVPGYGWVWYPGSVYRPAWVHWYWGPEYVGWCPSGYYASYYGSRPGFNVSFGIYGWAGGSWNHFEHWSFVASGHFGDRHQDRYVHRAREMERLVAANELQKGIITSDPGRAGKDPGEVFRRLRDEVERDERSTGRKLPDVSDFVARKPLDDRVREVVMKPKPVTSSKLETVSRQLPSAKPRDSMPRVDARTDRQAPRVEVRRDDVSGDKPVTRPYRIERPTEPGVTVKPSDKRPDPGDLRDRVAAPRDRSPVVTPRDVERDQKPASRPTVTPRDVERYREPARTAPPAGETSRPTVTPRDVERYREPVRTAPPAGETSRPTVRVAPSEPAPRATESEPSDRRDKVDSAQETVRAQESGSDREKGSKPSVSAKKKPRKKDN